MLAPEERLVRPNVPPPVVFAAASYAVAAYEARPTREPEITRSYEPAASVEWDVGGTESGFHVLGGALLVEDVRRSKGDNPLHVSVRLRNMLPVPVAAEVLPAMFDREGRRLISDDDRWRPILVPPFGRIVVSNYALVPGASRFVLFARPVAVHAEPVPPVPLFPSAP
jgi:hypothetical protein